MPALCAVRNAAGKNRHLGTIAEVCRAISLQLRHVSTIGKKNLLSSSISFTCPHNMVNFGIVASKIVFTAHRNARIASAVLAIAIPSVHLSVRLSHAGIVSKRRHIARCSLHRWIAKCV